MTRWSRSRADTMAPERASASASRTWAASSPGLWSWASRSARWAPSTSPEASSAEPSAYWANPLERPPAAAASWARASAPATSPRAPRRMDFQAMTTGWVPPALRMRSMSASAPAASPWCTRSTASASSGWPSRSSLLSRASRSAAPFEPVAGPERGMPGAVAVGVGLDRGIGALECPLAGSGHRPGRARPEPGVGPPAVGAGGAVEGLGGGLPALLGGPHPPLEQRRQAGIAEVVEDGGEVRGGLLRHPAVEVHEQPLDVRQHVVGRGGERGGDRLRQQREDRPRPGPGAPG